MQSVPVQLTQVPPKPTCTLIFKAGPCADVWRRYNQAAQQRTREELQLYVNRQKELASSQATAPLHQQIADLNKLATDQQAQIEKLSDQIQSDSAAALQAKTDYATAVLQAKTAAHTQGLQQGAGIGVGATLLLFGLIFGIKTTDPELHRHEETSGKGSVGLRGISMNDKEALQALQRGERLNQSILLRLSQRGLIKTTDVTNMDTPVGKRELLFTFFTQEAKSMLDI